MGADHKGPLAAFVVIAVVAAIVLVTSVRSQAVEVLTSVGHHLDRAVSSGVDVVERTVSTAPDAPATTGHRHRAPTDGPTVAPVTPVDPVGDPSTAPATHLAGVHSHGVHSHGVHHGPAASPGHGHHLGWTHGGAPGHGHGHAYGHARGHVHSHGRAHRHGHAHG